MIATALASRHTAVNKKYKKERKRIKYNLSDFKIYELKLMVSYILRFVSQ